MATPDCQQLTDSIKKLSEMKDDFDGSFAETPSNINRLFELQQQIKQKLEEILSQIWPFENLTKEEFHRSIEEQLQLMQDRGMLTIQDGIRGILGEGGKFCPAPTAEQIDSQIGKESEKLRRKSRQGFTMPLIVPFGLNLEVMASRVGSYVADLKDHGLIADDVNTQKIFKSWKEQYQQSLEVGAVYYPNSFDKDHHGGKTKSEVSSESAFPGWQILMVEPPSELPTKDNFQTIGGRTQLDPTGKAFGEGNDRGFPFDKWLKELSTNPVYKDEIGFTYEAWLAFYLNSVEKNHEITEKYKSGHPGTLLLGTFFPRGYLGASHWNEGLKSIELYRYDTWPGAGNSEHAPRMAVRIA